MKEILLYSSIFSFISEFFINQVEEAKDEDIMVRINSPGGDVLSTWGMIAKLREHEGNVSIKVDGQAASMAAYFLLFFDDIEALDFSRFTLHRASMFNESQRSEADMVELKEINKQLRTAMEAKLDIPKFERLAGVTLNEFFNGENVVDVNFNAKNAKKIKLIKNITNLAPEQIKALGEKFAAYHGKQTINEPPEPQKTTEKMTLAEFKAKHPELHVEIFNNGIIEGKKVEKDRAGAWMAFVDVDSKVVAEGIKGDENLSQTDMAEFSKKAMSAEALKKIEGDNADDTETDEPGTDGDKKVKAKTEFEAEVKTGLGLDKKDK